ncbi:MAG: response regulator [Myxococcota bacterium]
MSKTLLLADDSVVIQKLVALSFANEDIELVTVYNGDDAVEKIRETRPDLVLADVVMPGKSGYEVCEAIKQDPALAHVPVLLLTGTFEAFDEERAGQVGSDGHITKPFEAQALVERVNALLAAPPPAAEAAPEGAAAAQEAPAAENAEVYDFFDDELDAPLESESSASALSFDADAGGDDLGTAGEPLALDADPLAGGGDPLSGAGDPLAFDRDAGSDHTVAIMPEDVAFDAPPSLDAAAAVEDQPTVTASGLFGRDSAPAPAPPASEAAPESEGDPLATVLADDSFAPIATPSGNLNPDPMATILADEPEPSTPKAAQTGDGLFGDPDQSLGGAAAAAAGPPAPPAPAVDDDIEFGFTTEPPTSIEPPPDLEPLPASETPGLLEQADLDPAGSSAFDVSVSDLGAPAPPAAEGPPETVVAFGPADDEVAAPAPDVTPGLPSDDAPSFGPAGDTPPAASDWPGAPTPAPVEPMEAVTSPDPEPEPVASPFGGPASGADRAFPESATPSLETPTATPEPAPEIPVSAAANADTLPNAGNLSELMQNRVHETLEKVAWEAFADLSDSIVRQVLERVERVAWEVIPQMAETLVREEIRKMKGETED